jgi:hypothetical protein
LRFVSVAEGSFSLQTLDKRGASHRAELKTAAPLGQVTATNPLKIVIETEIDRPGIFPLW